MRPPSAGGVRIRTTIASKKSRISVSTTPGRSPYGPAVIISICMTRRSGSRRPPILLLLLLPLFDLGSGCACAPEHEIGQRVEAVALARARRGPPLTGPGADADHPV